MDALTNRSCYDTHEKLIFNWRLINSLKKVLPHQEKIAILQKQKAKK